MTDSRRYLRLVRSLAYDAALFERCIALIVRIISSQNIEYSNRDEDQRIFTSLFTIYYSGTHATVEQRQTVIRSLLSSEDPQNRQLGLAALAAALETSHFAGWDFEFGAASRDFGYWPSNGAAVRNWFATILTVVEDIAGSQPAMAGEVSGLAASKFRGLWSNAGIHDELERLFRTLPGERFWPQGWIAIRETIHYDSTGFSPEIAARIAALEVHLRPKDLVQEVRSVVLSESILYVGTDSTVDGAADQKSWEQVENRARALGGSVATDREALTELLSELLTTSATQLWSFGCGLAEGAEDPEALWNTLANKLSIIDTGSSNVRVLCGFLHQLNILNPELVSSLLEDAVKDEVLAAWFPLLQLAIPIDGRGVKRLIQSLEGGKAGVHMFRALMGGGASHDIPGSDFNALLRRIAVEADGLDIALELLRTRILFAPRRSTSDQLVEIGCELMSKLTFNKKQAMDEYNAGIIAKTCLVGERGAIAVSAICRNLKLAISNSETYGFYHSELLAVLLEVRPMAVLESLCGGGERELHGGLSMLEQNLRLRHNSLDAVPEDDLLSWCAEMPQIRYTAVAGAITAFLPSNETGKLELSRFGRKLLGHAPDRVGVLQKFIGQLGPAEALRILDENIGREDPSLLGYVRTAKIRLGQIVQANKEVAALMAKQNKDMDERFE